MNIMSQYNRRIYSGYYKKYDGKYVYVVCIAKNAETGEETVIFHIADYVEKTEYLTLSKKSFCETVEIDGKYVDKYSRQTQMKASELKVASIEADGFQGPKRKKQPLVLPDELDYRYYRQALTYGEYAKDLCTHYLFDVRKYNLCKSQHKLIGISKDDYEILREDLLFFRDAMKTILKEYDGYFRERYLDGKSIRKYAEAHSMNRGSVEHLQRKFIKALAELLRQRDMSDGKKRIKPSY